MSVVQELQARAQNTVEVLLEVNVAGEETKSGLDPGEVDALPRAGRSVRQGRVRGPHVHAAAHRPTRGTRRRTSPARANWRSGFRASWGGRYTFARLSMGTSADYEVAVREGATIVRVGSVLF